MPGQSDFGVSELHETIRGGERVLIRPARPEDMALYQDFLRNVSAEDLRLRFFLRTSPSPRRHQPRRLPPPAE
jgi:LPS O-antigen subunit length determinant protein (WzzB/FepE family)